MSKNIERIFTDTPLIDEIVYQVKGMIYDGIILKDTEEANNNETVYSLKAADRYADIIEGHTVYEMYEYSYSHLMKLPYMNRDIAIMYSKNNALIPDNIKPDLLKIANDDFLSTYQEQNNYYRRLYGLPDYGQKGIHLSNEQIAMLTNKHFDAGKYVHEMDNNEIKILETSGVLDVLKSENPTKQYLWHLGERRVDPYIARKTPKFGLLYLPACESNEVYNRFKELIIRDRAFILNCLYSEAFKFQSEYYDKFLMAMIIVQAFVDMIVLSPEYIIQRELFDMRTIQYVFESQGVTFFPDIPLKYQKRLVKNLNRLIKYKSCDKNLIDIASLFGFENAKLFKYWILKDPIMNEDGTYRRDMKQDPKTGLDVEDLEANYELKFIKVPIEGGIVEEAIQDPFNIVSYDEVVTDDVYWNGVYTAEYVKHRILEHEFNMHMSKYIGLETVYSMTELALQLSYFINLVMYSVDTSELVVEVPELSSTNVFPLIDLLIALYSLGYIYRGVKDTIIYDPVQSMDVCGFNIEVDMAKLSEYVEEKGFTLEELGVDKFMAPKDGIFTFNQLMEIYTNNKNIYKHLVHEITHANDKDIYDIYYTIYNSLMITKLNFDYFTQYGIKPDTYLEFLSIKNSPLHDIIMRCKLIEKIDDRQTECSKIINYIVDAIYVYLDEEEFRYIFHEIPTASMDYLRKYLFEVLNFFKSYKVDFTHVNTVYKLDDRLENWITVIDRIKFKYLFNWTDKVNIEDFINMIIHLVPKENIDLIEKMSLDITHWQELLFNQDKVKVNDIISELLVHIIYNEYISPKDCIGEYKHLFDWGEIITLKESMINDISLEMKEKININEAIWIKSDQEETKVPFDPDIENL